MLRRVVPLAACSALLVTAACTSHVDAHGSGSRSPSVVAATSSSLPQPTPTTSHPAAPTTHAPVRRTTTSSAAGVALPLGYATGDATQVITAVAPSMSSTTGTLQAWQKTGAGWRQVGAAVEAWFGSDGLTSHMSESISATPVGSFTLTQAFGADANPGTALPYFRTTPADWWISQTTGPGKALYNTHQHCSSSCAFTQGAPNEHLYYELPYYDYAVVIDYNTRNAPGGVRLGAGSAVFLHVSVHAPTAGCVSIDESRLVDIMRWLSPSAHPRILIGV
jgi:L,D-peptidoglycan transpeptidase YkuD (ErfK/YbiS/YcfS/YnhG family)